MYARIAALAHHVIHGLASDCCCFQAKRHQQHPRDEIKLAQGSSRDSTTELWEWGRMRVAEEEEEEGGPSGSDDEDVLPSLGASYRAWRVYHREKRAHDYTKSRLVETLRREAALTKQFAHVGGSGSSIERILMRLEDLEASLAIYEHKDDAGATTGSEDVDECPCPLHADRLRQAEAAALHWKTQCQHLLPELASLTLEKDRLTEELRKAKKTAVLMLNRQYVQLGTRTGAPRSLSSATLPQRIDKKKRSYSDIQHV